MALKISVNVIIILISITNTFILIRGAVPSVSIQALKSGGFRVIIPDTGNVTEFRFTANINEKLLNRKPGHILQETHNLIGNNLLLEFPNKLNIGDIVNYRVSVIVNRLGYEKDNQVWEVSELLDSYPQLTTRCGTSSTRVNGRNACIGEVILEDSFNESNIDFSKWEFEHRIPTYSEPNSEFNSYQNIEETRFIKSGVLYLQPIALKEESSVRGTLNLRDGCTSQKEIECFYEQASAFLLPPVKSAKMKSLINFKYGRIEIQAKLPAGDWIVPVIQLQPRGNMNNNLTKIWIAYSRGNNHLKGNSNEDIGSRLIFAGPIVQNDEPGRSRYLATRQSDDPFYADFHVYTLEWLPGSLKFYFDSQLFGDIRTSSFEFDAEYHLSLGVSVGGTNDFPDGFNSDSGTKPWSNSERNFIKKFFDARNTWLETWNGDDTALKINNVKITAI